MYRGANKVTLDDKGRLAVPARYREQLSNECDNHLVVSIDRDYCLMVYPLPAWESLETKLMQLPSLNRQARRLQRLMLGYATDVEIDSHGRILVSQELREFASIERKAILIGQGHRFELWDEARWADRRDEWLSASNGEGDLPTELESLSF
ncbi:MAG: division/cell wall cluster transcriptional repressor MraZ [Gammaproteobacteria bacterium]|nr:division/cell wall cluster transcriptional repressor MraZ [Gammaproteobacteria bacterium]